MAMIYLILETARRLGLDRAPRGLTELHRAYLQDHPGTTVGRSQGSFDATLNLHVINMRSRFPKPREPRARANWLSRPLFKRVAPGRYMLLTAPELAWFREAVARNEPLVFRDEFEIPDTGAPRSAQPAGRPAGPATPPARESSSERTVAPFARDGASLDERLRDWLVAHDERLDRFEQLVPLHELASESGAGAAEIRARLTDGSVPPYHVWSHVHAGKRSRSKPYALRLGAPDAVALDWEESVVAAAEAELTRRGFETQRQLGSETHLAALLARPSLAGLARGHNLRDLWALRVGDGHADLWIVEAKGKEAGGFEHYCVAEALGQLFPLPAEPLSELLGSSRGAGHGLCWDYARRLLPAWRAQGLKVRVTLGLLLPFWAPDVIWGSDARVREVAGPCFARPLRALHEFIESGRSDATSRHHKYERAFGAVLESLERDCGLRQLAVADEGLRFRVLLPTADGSTGFKLIGIE